MLTAFLIISTSVLSEIPSHYHSLVDEAYSHANLRKSATEYDNVMEPGFYEFGGSISFTLSKKLMNGQCKEIRGYALSSDRKAIAIVKNLSSDFKVEEERPYFADPTSQIVFHLNSLVADDGKVQLFSVSAANPIQVFSNLLMKTGISDGFECSLNMSSISGAQCKAWMSYNWEKASSGEDPFDLGPIEQKLSNGVGYKVGAYGQAVSSATVHFESMFSVVVDVDFELDLKGGFGFSLPSVTMGLNLPSPEILFPIYGFGTKILGIELSFGVNGFISATIRNISVTIPELYYYRDYVYKYKKSARYVNSNWIQSPAEWTFYSEVDTNLDGKLKVAEDVVFGFDPEIEAGIKLGVTVGSLLDTSMKVGAEASLLVNFDFNRTACTSPYLYGSVGFQVGLFVDTPGFRVFSIVLIPTHRLEWVLFRTGVVPSKCLFSPSNSEEGIIDFKSDNRVPSLVVRPNSAYVITQHSSNITYSVKMDAYPSADSSTVFRSSQIPPFTFAAGKYGQKNSVPLRSVLALEDVRDSSVVKFSVMQKGSFVYYPTEGANLHSKGDVILCTSSSQSLCVNTTIAGSEIVPEFKEFSSSSRFVSVKPLRAVPGDIYGLITHGSDIPYRASLSKFRTIDDSTLSFDDARLGEYKVRRILNITVDSFSYKASGLDGDRKASLWFYRKYGDELKSIGQIVLEHTKPNTNQSSKQLGADEFFVPFDISDVCDALVVDLTVEGFWTANWGKRFTFRWEEIDYAGSFTRIKSLIDDEAQLKLSFNNVIPTALFEVEQVDGVNYTGIVSRVFQPPFAWSLNSTNNQYNFSMLQNETYGILRFFIKFGDDKFIKNNNFSTVFTLPPHLIPLCKYMRLDDNTVMVNHQHDETIFSARDQTTYFNGVITVNIPFRRMYFEECVYNVSIISCFITAKNGLCSNTGSFKGTIIRGFSTGCVETKSVEKGLGYSPLFSDVRKDFFAPFTIKRKKWTIYNYIASSDVVEFQNFELRLRVSNFRIGENSSNLFIPRERLNDFRVSESDITVHCDKCSRVRAETGLMTHYLKRNDNGMWTFKPGLDAVDVRFIAECDNVSESYCQVTENFSDDGFAIIETGTDGVDDFNHTHGNPLYTGASLQLVWNRSSVSLFKSWSGSVKRVARNLGANNVTIFVAPHVNANYTTILAKFGSHNIPLSFNLFRNNPTLMYELLNITANAQSLTQDDILFSRDGRLTVSNSIIGDVYGYWSNISQRQDLRDTDASKLTEVPESHLKSLKFACMFGESNGVCLRGVVTASSKSSSVSLTSSGLVIGVVVSVFVAVVIFSATTLYLVNRRKRKAGMLALDSTLISDGVVSSYV